LYWLQSPAVIAADITASLAGKKRGFCRLRLLKIATACQH
jgi:hypothetical protein